MFPYAVHKEYVTVDHNIDVQLVFSWAPKLARKCKSKHWFPCGADGRSFVRSVSGHVITKFSGMASPSRRDRLLPPLAQRIFFEGGFRQTKCHVLKQSWGYHLVCRIFENIPQSGPEDSHRNLAIAWFLVTAVRKNIGGLLACCPGWSHCQAQSLS